MLLTAARLFPIALKSWWTETLVRPRYVEALGILCARGGQSALIDVSTFLDGVSSEALGTPALIRPRSIHACGRVPTGECPVRGRTW